MADKNEMPHPYPFQEPSEGDAVRVRFIDINNAPQEAEGEVVDKTNSAGMSWVAVVDAGHTTYSLTFDEDRNHCGVAGYGPACEVVVIS